MKFTRAGIILNTENTAACRAFYADVLGLPVLHHFGHGEDEITIFGLGETYLMVEHGGVAHPDRRPVAACPVKFRFNVADIGTACSALRAQGVDVTVLHHDWGTTAEFQDPDGNRCALRSDEGFGLERLPDP